jgi:hypothetical protein
MFVVDKVVDEDRRDDPQPEDVAEITLPNGDTKALGPSPRDAFAVFEDLCLLANSERPRFLKLDSLRKTFALELIESVLTNYHELFRKVDALILVVVAILIVFDSMKSFSCYSSTTSVPCS